VRSSAVTRSARRPTSRRPWTRRPPLSRQPGYFYPKTLVADIDNDAPLVQEEQFGPALPIIRYTPMVPFGGAKHSGYGLEFGVDGLKAVSVPRSSAANRHEVQISHL
jgi:acyl-CoA reductase-like NAD-dependent aldehyde dehydrogenase